MTMRTRFAPSPTGYLHIGGVRTALFNWLLARRHGGEFILRIDDTDAQRNRAEAVKPILDGFTWLGIDWDEGPTLDGSGDSFGPHKPYFQGQRNEKYVAAAMKLMAEGQAYPDYTPPEQQDADRKAADKARKPYVHRGSNRDTDPAENLRLYREKPAPILLKVPDGETVAFDDQVRGRVEVKTDTIRDPALLRAPGPDGDCRALYSFATVVDEIDFQITHVVRAEEHLSNTPSQILIYKALGAPVPIFAHIPLVNYKGEKMSKRKLPQLTAQEIAKLKACGWSESEIAARDDLNIATVAYYRELGYLPAALINYLVRLGWSLDESSEFIPLDVAKANFSLERVTKAAGNFDPDKLYWLQGEYMRRLTLEEKIEGTLPFLKRAGLISDTTDEVAMSKIRYVLEHAGERVKLFADAIYYLSPILQTSPNYDPKAVSDKLTKPGVAQRLREYSQVIKEMDPFDAEQLKLSFIDFAAKQGIKPKDLDTPLRVALTGVTVGFGLHETMTVLGKAEVLRRIDEAITRFAS
jgi:nondiscriminating glutamyl-tRNA synthetase